jgi:putative transposase
MNRLPYSTDLSDDQWRQIEPIIPPAEPGGRPRVVDMREVVNAILYRERTGCAWRLLPHDFPPWGTVAYYYRRWRTDGAWQPILDSLSPPNMRRAHHDGRDSHARE